MMNISAEEKNMYGVMKALYDSGIPISFKSPEPGVFGENDLNDILKELDNPDGIWF